MSPSASAETRQVPSPASAKTSGTVSVGDVLGAMVETDCASVSSGERVPARRPNEGETAVFGPSLSVAVDSCMLVCPSCVQRGCEAKPLPYLRDLRVCLQHIAGAAPCCGKAPGLAKYNRCGRIWHGYGEALDGRGCCEQFSGEGGL